MTTMQLIANFVWLVLQLIANSIWDFMQLIANFIKLGVPLKESLVFALKRKREGSRSILLLYTGIEIHTVEGLIDLPDGALERVVLLNAKKRGVTKLLLQHIDFLHSVLVGGVKGLLAYSIAEKYDFILCFARFTLPLPALSICLLMDAYFRICSTLATSTGRCMWIVIRPFRGGKERCAKLSISFIRTGRFLLTKDNR